MRGELRYEGKGKRLYACDVAGELIQEFKDDATAFDGIKHDVIAGKGRLNCAISSFFFERLAAAGIPLFLDAAHSTAHNKVMVMDRQRVLTGSYNFKKDADAKNAENLLVLDSPELAKLYLDNYEAHKAHSEPYEGVPATAP